MIPTTVHRDEALGRLLYREFLRVPRLYHRAGMPKLPESVASLINCPVERALDKLAADPLLSALDYETLVGLLTVRDMTVIARTAADVATELRKQDVSYDDCCATALCFAVAGKYPHAYAALRCAASRDDDWAKHHLIYGLVLGLQGQHNRALWELGLALTREPYEEGRETIRLAMEVLKNKPSDTKQ